MTTSRFEELEAFVTIVEAGSLTKAASKLGVTLSVVSRRLRDLEERLGLPLLIRTTRQQQPSEAGSLFYGRAKQILQDMNASEEEARADTHAISGRIRLTAPLSYTLSHLGPALLAFAAQYPDIELDLDLSDRQIDLIGEGFDLAVRIGALADSQLRLRRLGQAKLLTVASPAFLARYPGLRQPEDLAGVPELAYQGSAPNITWPFTRPDGTKGRLRLTSRFKCNNGDMLLQAAEQGLGVAMEPDFLAGPSLKAGKVRTFFEDHCWPSVHISLVYPGERGVQRRVQTLIEFLVHHAGA